MDYLPEDPMEYPEWLIWATTKAAWIIHRKRNRSLCAVAQEKSNAKGYRVFSHRFFDWMFWFDPHHCEQSLLWYRLEELNRQLKEEELKHA